MLLVTVFLAVGTLAGSVPVQAQRTQCVLLDVEILAAREGLQCVEVIRELRAIRSTPT